jgi:siroheme synthase
MGREAAGTIAAKLLEHGMSPQGIVHIVENGTLPNQRVFKAAISKLQEALAENQVTGPSIIYVGLSDAEAGAEILPFPARADSRAANLRVVS